MARIEVHTPTCLKCNNKLTPNYIEVRDNDPNVIAYEQKKYKTRITGYGYNDNNYFCSSHCGFDYAIDIFDNLTINDLGSITVNNIRNSYRSDIEEANAHRGFTDDGTLTAKRLLDIHSRLHDKSAFLNQDKLSFTIMFHNQ